MKKLKNKAAFPMRFDLDDSMGSQGGMTMREYYAGLAMRALINRDFNGMDIHEILGVDLKDTQQPCMLRKAICRVACRYADSLIEELGPIDDSNIGMGV